MIFHWLCVAYNIDNLFPLLVHACGGSVYILMKSNLFQLVEGQSHTSTSWQM